jgi:hypothetical protein
MIIAWLDAFEPRTALWQQWQEAEPDLAGANFRAIRLELLECGVSPERKDALLAALIRRSRGPGGSEARVAVITCLLPGVRKLAGQFARCIGWHDAVAEVIAALWIAVDRFDPETGRDRVASRLLATARGPLVRRANRERAWRERTTAQVRLDTFEASPSAEGRATISTAVDAGVLSDLDAALIEATRLGGLTLLDAATLLGVNYEAAKKRRRRAETSWLAWWAPSSRPRTDDMVGAAA